MIINTWRRKKSKNAGRENELCEWEFQFQFVQAHWSWSGVSRHRERETNKQTLLALHDRKFNSSHIKLSTCGRQFSFCSTSTRFQIQQRFNSEAEKFKTSHDFFMNWFDHRHFYFIFNGKFRRQLVFFYSSYSCVSCIFWQKKEINLDKSHNKNKIQWNFFFT